jgi:hypothetical protein
MQRSVFLPSGHVVKNNSPVVFSDILDLNEIILGKFNVESALSNIKNSAVFEQSQNLKDWSAAFEDIDFVMAEKKLPNPGKSIKKLHPKTISDQAQTGKNEMNLVQTMRPFIYKLSAVVLHYGHHESGHFITLRRVTRPDKNDMWFRISDADVDRVSDVESEVFRHGSRYCYMLFYERLEAEKQ